MSANPPSLRRPRVLLVDDDPAIGRAVTRYAEAELDVTYDADANAAIRRLLAGEQYDLILCDLHMPGVDGGELLEVVASAVPQLRERFVFLTGGAFLPSDRPVLDAAAGGTLWKPFGRRDLFAVVGRCVPGYRPPEGAGSRSGSMRP